jgi:quinol monooxygenase YgiN
VIEALRPAIAAVHEEPGCKLYAIHDAPDGTIVMIEKCTSVQELDDQGAGKAVRELNASLEGLLASPVEVTRLVPLPAGTEEQGEL